MPDSTLSPGVPLSRDFGRRTIEPGIGATRRTSPGETAANGIAHANGSAVGSIARPERAELRWRDVQWVDFTSEPDSGMDPAPVPAVPVPARMSREAPPLGMLIGFAEVSPTTRAAAKVEEIPGLAPRFTRLPVPRLAPSPERRPLPTDRRPPTPAARPVGLVVQPRTPSVSPLASKSLPERNAASVATPGERRERVDGERPLPASLSTPVSTGVVPGEPEPYGWRIVVSGLAAGVARSASAVAMAARGGLARARIALPRKPRGVEAIGGTPTKLQAIRRPIVAAIDRVSGFVAAYETRLRVTGVAALLVVLVALGAYLSGALIAHVAEPSAPARPATASASSDAVAKQLTLADKPLHPAPATPPPAAVASEPPADPAARAAFYIARAKSGDPAAQYDVGVLYAQGRGLVQDYGSAATWFRIAAAQGNIAAQYNLGVLSERGLGVPANTAEAVNWYRSAAERNHPGAQFNLAVAYATGKGAPQDFAAAARWYQKAAAQGLMPAMTNLAILYEAGDGVDRSPVDAYAWYSAAGERGDAVAKTRAAALFQQFNDRDKARAEGLAATIGAVLERLKSPAPPA